MKDVCNFIPTKIGQNNIECYHFVYETGIKKFQMPITRKNYYINIVFKGNGTLNFEGKNYPLSPGTLFFSFPESPFSIDCSNDFTFLYISFNGEGTSALLDQFNIKKEHCVFYNLKTLSDFWMNEVRRINQTNAVLLTESILMYSLSYTTGHDEKNVEISRLESVIEYVKMHFNDAELSLTRISDMFFYNKKYLSSLFANKTGVKFTEYLNNIRINEAKKLMREGETSVSDISSKCGFSDAYYFSKVFKKYTGSTPSSFMKQ